MTHRTVHILLASTCIYMCACVPVEPPEDRLIGTWRVQRECGKETLELRADKSYVQGIEYTGGERASHSGRAWRVKPATSRLEGGSVVLQDGILFCDPFDKKLAEPQRIPELQLTTIWEWGRLTLSFNPDLAGFVRQ